LVSRRDITPPSYGIEDVREVEREAQEKNRRGNKIWEERRGR
jgi:hypothetical protein